MLCQLGAGKLKDDGARYVYILPRSQVGAQGHSELDFLVRSTRQGRTCPKTERIQRPAVKQEVGSEALQPISKADCKPSAVALDEERSPRNDLLVVKSMMGTMHKVRNYSLHLQHTKDTSTLGLFGSRAAHFLRRADPDINRCPIPSCSPAPKE